MVDHNAAIMNSVINLVEQHKQQSTQLLENNLVLQEIDDTLIMLNVNVTELQDTIQRLQYTEIHLKKQLKHQELLLSGLLLTSSLFLLKLIINRLK